MKTNQVVRSMLATAMLVALAGTTLAAGEAFFVVKISDMKKNVECQMLTQSELKTLEKELQNEAKSFPQAVAAAGKDWREDEVFKNFSYPGAKLVARKIVGMPERFTKQEEADKKLNFYLDAEKRKAEREREKLQEMEKKDKKAYDALMQKQKDQEEKDVQFDKAVKMVQSRLDELMGRAPVQPAPGQKPAEKPADEKPKGKEEAGKVIDKAL